MRHYDYTVCYNKYLRQKIRYVSCDFVHYSKEKFILEPYRNIFLKGQTDYENIWKKIKLLLFQCSHTFNFLSLENLSPSSF